MMGLRGCGLLSLSALAMQLSPDNLAFSFLLVVYPGKASIDEQPKPVSCGVWPCPIPSAWGRLDGGACATRNANVQRDHSSRWIGPCLGVESSSPRLDCDISAFAIQVTSCRLVEYAAIGEREWAEARREWKQRLGKIGGEMNALFPWDSDCDCLEGGEIGDF